MRRLLRSGWGEAPCVLLLVVLLLVVLALVRVAPLPVDLSHALPAWCLAVTLLLRPVREETGREVDVPWGARVHLTAR